MRSRKRLTLRWLRRRKALVAWALLALAWGLAYRDRLVRSDMRGERSRDAHVERRGRIW